MLRSLLAAMVFCLLTGSAQAISATRTTLSPGPSPGEQCRTAIATAELGHGVPPQLLAAIGRVESGRRDPETGIRGAWPWTINAEGQGSYFDSKADAIRAVEALQARGVRSIDVGCMQVNLMHHPAAFPNLDQAFEPAINANYAARFLVRLYGQTADWTKATANYHSGNPAEGDPYAAKVTSIWPEEQRRAGLTPPPLAGPASVGMFARAISPFPARPPPRMFAMAGTRPGMMQPGMVPLGMTPGGFIQAEAAPSRMMLPRVMPGMMQAETSYPGMSARGILAGMLPTGTARSGASFGQAMMNPGRGLASYRAMPVRAATPIGPTPRMPYRLATK